MAVCLAAFVLSASPARAQFQSWVGYVPERCVIIRSYPVYGCDIGEERYALPQYYLYDYVNRANPLTPEPAWRSMFPGLEARIISERRQFGVSGQSGREFLYWREYR